MSQLPDPLVTLVDRAPHPPTPQLPPDLRALYGGDLLIPAAPADRPYVIANFVAALDGAISFNLPDHDTGNAISGGDMSDHMVMGILRAEADAVLWGARSYMVSRRFLSTPAAIWPPGAAWFAQRRAAAGKPPMPLAVIVTGSGDIDITGTILQSPDQPALVITTDAGAAKLTALRGAPATQVRSVGAGAHVSPLAVAQLLRVEFDVRVLLHEGGPGVLGAFLQAGLVDEQFLTIAPQFVGRSQTEPRPNLIEHVAFTPATAPWATLLSLKQGGDLLFTRYRVTGARS
jgi:riboflavin biosynthesis pyrimidine reductase